MALIQRPRHNSSPYPKPFSVRKICAFTLVVFVYFKWSSTSSPSSSRDNMEENIHQKANNLREAATHILPSTKRNSNFKTPERLVDLLQQNKIVGDKLVDIQSGTLTIEEAIHGGSKKDNNNNNINVSMKNGNSENKKPPMTIQEVLEFLSSFIHELHLVCVAKKKATYQDIWQAYHDLAVKTLYPWDREYLQRMPERRFDDSIFLSLASYRDENCLSTITNAYGKAKNPDKLFTALVQQNCEEHCRSGVLEGGRMEDVPPDDDCHKLFCESPEGKPYCDSGQVRALHIQESESLGPYAARYFASKLWDGEQWYMQIDSHMTFLQDWDAISVEMLQNAPTKKPVISHYPPPHTADLQKKSSQPAPRLCGPVFATSDLESQIIRLEGLADYDQKKLKTPRFAPFVAAGYFVAHSDFLREVPFDPFLPWIFMGEEIIMSARLWTHGYDIYSPTQSVLGHIYVRRHKPKFWESVHRVFTYGVHNPLQMLVLDRIKYQLGYPEAAADMIKPKSVLTAVDQYTMGTERKVEDYLKIVGLDMNTKEVTYTAWCETGKPPKGFEKYNHLYE